MATSLSAAQTKTLLQRAIFWITVAKDWAYSADDLPERSTIDLGILIVSSLTHLSNCLMHLEEALGVELRDSANEFREAWERDARRVRNLLEHEEEYIAGVGKFQSEIPPDAAEAPRVLTWVAGKVIAIQVLGESLSLAPHLARALSMEQRLRDQFEATVKS